MNTWTRQLWEKRATRWLLPLIGVGFMLLGWAFVSATVAQSLPSPAKTWEVSRTYVLEPFETTGLGRADVQELRERVRDAIAAKLAEVAGPAASTT